MQGARSPVLVVSIHARTGRATPTPSRNSKSSVSFNSRAHGARDDQLFEGCCDFAVSIHARTGRATPKPKGHRRQPNVSIHARTGRATPKPLSTPARGAFQFTRARGARPAPIRTARRRVWVSIHARTGRATLQGQSSPVCRSCFNSRAHGARDATPEKRR